MSRHRFDPLSLVFGVLFLAVAMVGLVDRELLTWTDLRWMAPGLLIALGALLLVMSSRTAEREPEVQDDTEDGFEGGAAGAAVEGEVVER